LPTLNETPYVIPPGVDYIVSINDSDFMELLFLSTNIVTLLKEVIVEMWGTRVLYI